MAGSNMYFEDNRDLSHARQTLSVTLLGLPFVFATDAGVFSKSAVDFGSQALIAHFSPHGKRLLDLGCGYGVIGIALAKRYGLAATLSDINPRALELTAENLAENGVTARVVASDGFVGFDGKPVEAATDEKAGEAVAADGSAKFDGEAVAAVTGENAVGFDEKPVEAATDEKADGSAKFDGKPIVAVVTDEKSVEANDATDSSVKFDDIVTNPPIRAGKAVVHRFLTDAARHLATGGALTVVIQKKQGAPSAQKKLLEVFGNCEIVARVKGYYVLRSLKS